MEEIEEIEEKYLKRLEEIEKKLGQDDNLDQEKLHIEFDDIILDLLLELGYKDIVVKYIKEMRLFWYS